MKLQNVLLVVCTTIGLTATMAAQGARADAPQANAQPQAGVQAKSVILTGCMAQGVDADHYMLTHAVRQVQPHASTAEAGTSNEVGSDKARANDRTGSYDLDGGEFKAHLGHTVEVTVTSGSAPETADTLTSESATGKPLPKLNVVSVKMLSATCS
jgi:hypothetical protein